MTIIQAISQLMEMVYESGNDMEPLTFIAKTLAEQESSIAELNKSNDYLRAKLAEANQRTEAK